MKIQLSELNLTYVLGWYGTCDNDQDFDLNTISSSISSVLQIAEDNYTWKSFEPDNYSSDFYTLVPGHIYYFTFNRGTEEVEIPNLVKTNHSDSQMSLMRVTDQCQNSGIDDIDFGSDDSDYTPTSTYSPDYQGVPFTDSPVNLVELCCSDADNRYDLVSGEKYEESGASFVAQHDGVLCFNDLSVELDGNMVVYYVAFSESDYAVDLEITFPTSSPIYNSFRFTTSEGVCYEGTLDVVSPDLNRFTKIDFPTPTPVEDSTIDGGIDSGIGDDNQPTPTPTPTSSFTPSPYYPFGKDTPTPYYPFGKEETPTPTESDYVLSADDSDAMSDDNTNDDDSVDGSFAPYNHQVHQNNRDTFMAMSQFNYSFDFQWTGDVPLESLNIVTINVEENSISEITRDGVGIDINATPREYYTLDTLFTYVDNEVTRNPEIVNISYNTELGYITSFELDMSVDQEFDKVGFRVSNFMVASNMDIVDPMLTDEVVDTTNSDDTWSEEDSYYEEGEVPVYDDGTTIDSETDMGQGMDAEPISELPAEEEDSDYTESQDIDSDYGSDSDYGADSDYSSDSDYISDDGMYESPYTDSNEMYDQETDDLNDMYDPTSDFDQLPDGEFIIDDNAQSDDSSDQETNDSYESFTDGVSNDVEQVNGDILENELPMGGSTLEEVTSEDSYMIPLPNDIDISDASEENPYEDLDTLQ